MCNLNILVKERYGYIATCEHCQVFYLTFGNFSMQLAKDDFCIYMDFINDYSKRYVKRKNKLCRDITINTLIDNLQLVLNYQELVQLRELMFGAILVYETEQLFS